MLTCLPPVSLTHRPAVCTPPPFFLLVHSLITHSPSSLFSEIFSSFFPARHVRLVPLLLAMRPPPASLTHHPTACAPPSICSTTLHSPGTSSLSFYKILSCLSCMSCLPRAPFPWPCALLTPTVNLSRLGTYHGGMILHSLQPRHLHNDMCFPSGNTNNSLSLRDWAPRLDSCCARPPGV